MKGRERRGGTGEEDREGDGKGRGGQWRGGKGNNTLRTPCRIFLATPLSCCNRLMIDPKN